jgi:hypothetical protein
MIGRAIEQRWDIRPEYKAGVIRRLMEVIANPDSSAREITAASRAIIAAEGQNREDQVHDEQADAQRSRFLAIAERLGLNQNTEPAIEVRATRSDNSAADGAGQSTD